MLELLAQGTDFASQAFQLLAHLMHHMIQLAASLSMMIQIPLLFLGMLHHLLGNLVKPGAVQVFDCNV
jgi:hypothetical protein